MMNRGNGRREVSGWRPHEKGMVLVIAVAIAVVILLLALPLLTKLSAQYGTTGKGSRAVSALCLAEAGVVKAVRELNGGSWVGTEGLTTDLTMAIDDFETPGGAIVGDVDITVRPLNDADKTRVVESTGSFRHRGRSAVARTVRVILMKTEAADASGEAAYIIRSWDSLSAAN